MVVTEALNVGGDLGFERRAEERRGLHGAFRYARSNTISRHTVQETRKTYLAILMERETCVLHTRNAQATHHSHKPLEMNQ